MPSTSQAQSRFMHAAAEGKIKGVSPQVGQDFVAADAGRKISKLPEHVKKRKADPDRVKHAFNTGRISEAQARKMMG